MLTCPVCERSMTARGRVRSPRRRVGTLLALMTIIALAIAAYGAPTASAADESFPSSTTAEVAEAKREAAAAKKQAAEAATKAREAKACAGALAALDAGRTDQAKAQYDTLGEAKCAAGGLATIRSCELGDAYRAQDKRSDAATAYKKALSEDPNAPCAIKGVEKPVASGVSRFTTWITNALPVALIYLAAGLVALLALLLAGYYPPFGRRLAHVPVLGAILSPRLTIGPVDDTGVSVKTGVAITARIKERLQRFREEALRHHEPDYELDHGTGEEEFADLVSGDSVFQTALKNARELSDQTKTIAAFASLIYAVLPVERLTITGAICTQDDQTASGTFSLERDAQLKAATTVTGPATQAAKTSPNGSDFVALADHAAAWAQYVVARVLATRDFTPDQAESYALVQIGLDHELAGDYELAIAAFLHALALNSRNWAARVNLAVTEAHLAKPAEAIGTVRSALTDMTGRAA
jgi:tetratricopeptide (TPR) repeat protein